jgi:Ca2+-binding RTX toxin-like protein
MLAAGAMLAAGGDAQARPYGFTGVDCDDGGVNICVMSDTQWTCDTRANGEAGPTRIQVVYANDSFCDDEDYCAYGTDDAGVKFFCAITNTAIRSIWAIGTIHDDQIRFQDDENLSYTLNTHTSGVSVTGVAAGGDDSDTILGSDAVNDDYRDILHGDDGDDTIDGDDGIDDITGDEGYDTIYGGSHDDTIHGGPGNDTLRGEGGADTIRGGSGADVIMGGDGDEPLLDGQAGNDIICGDDGVDYAHGGSGDDKLWVDDETAPASGSEETNGGNGGETAGDSCQDDGNARTDCELPNLTARPSECTSP